MSGEPAATNASESTRNDHGHRAAGGIPRGGYWLQADPGRAGNWTIAGEGSGRPAGFDARRGGPAESVPQRSHHRAVPSVCPYQFYTLSQRTGHGRAVSRVTRIPSGHRSSPPASAADDDPGRPLLITVPSTPTPDPASQRAVLIKVTAPSHLCNTSARAMSRQTAVTRYEH